MEFTAQPRLGLPPVRRHGAVGHAQRLGRLLNCQFQYEPALHDLPPPGMFAGETFQQVGPVAHSLGGFISQGLFDPVEGDVLAVPLQGCGGPVALAYSRFDEQTRSETHAEYLASIAPYRNGEGYAIPGEFVVVRGEKPRVSWEH